MDRMGNNEADEVEEEEHPPTTKVLTSCSSSAPAFRSMQPPRLGLLPTSSRPLGPS